MASKKNVKPDEQKPQGLTSQTPANEWLVVPTCDTCDHWKFGVKADGCDEDLPYCKELHYYIVVQDYVHTTRDFGCIKHSFLQV